MINDRVRLPAMDTRGAPLHQAREYLFTLCGNAEGNLADTGFHPPPPRPLDGLPPAAGPTVCVIPGAARGESKRWTGFAAAAKIVLGQCPDCRILVAGSANESTLCARVAAEIGPGAANVAGRTSLAEFAALLGHCRLVLCNDSGGMHLAAAVGTPLVALFGITDPARTGPLGERIRLLQHSERRSRDVPRTSAAAQAALRAISVAEAVAAVADLLPPA